MRNLSEAIFLPQDADLSGIHWSEANWPISRSKPTQPDFFLARYMKKYENISLENPQQLSVPFAYALFVQFKDGLVSCLSLINIDYHGFIIDLSFVYPKSEFRPSKHQKSPLTTALSRPGDHVQKGHGKCIGKAGATIRVQSDLSDHFLKGWHLGSKFCQMLAYGRRGCDDYFMGGRIVPTFFLALR